MSEEFSFDLDEKSIKNIKEVIGLDEIEARHKRFMNGTETIDDLINHIYHYKIKNNDGLDVDLVEKKYYEKIVDLYNKEKEKNRQSKMRIVQLENEITARIEDINKYFISKDKIKEKIEELEKERKRKDEEDTINPFYDQIDITHIIEVLQELLKEE